jgi:F420-dependent oxidoreductase-like protein
MAAMTLDHLSGGRFVLGLGVSGPQVVEGWYGQPYDAPLARTVEYIEIIRKVFDRQGPVSHDGTHFQLPQRQGTGLGHPMKSIVHPLRNDLPIVLGAEGPKNVALAAEVADGWLPIFFSPGAAHVFEDSLDEGFSRPGARRTRDTFEVFASVPVIINDDLEQAAAVVKPSLALYIGGMGARSMNFHFNLIARMGFEAEATKVRDLYLAGQRSDAIASVPDALVESMALIGSKEKIRDDLDEWRESIVTTLLVGGSLETLRTMAELVL